MKYISEIKLTELVKNFMDDLDHTKGQQERKNKTFNLLYQFENLYLKEIEKQNSLINKMRCCGNCKHNIKPTTKESNLFCCECKKLDKTKDNIILTKWEFDK